MKKLDFTTGGIPNDILDYLDWLQSGILQISHAIGTGIKNGHHQAFYVGNIDEVSGDVIISSDFYVHWINEWYAVDSQTIPGTKASLQFSPVTEYPPDMPVTLASGNTHNVQIHKKMAVIADPTGNGILNLASIPRFDALIEDMLIRRNDSWHEVGGQGEPPFLGGQNYSQQNKLMFRKNSFTNEIELNGWVKNISPGQAIFKSPYQPSVDRKQLIFGVESSTQLPIPAILTLRIDGIISAWWDNSNILFLSLDGVKFLID